MSKIIVVEQATPSTPAADRVAIYAKAGGQLSKLSDDGSERRLLDGTDLIAGNFIDLDISGDATFGAGSTLQKALSGDIVFECNPSTVGTSAATLNAAAVGTHTQDVTVNLKDAAGNLHKWASLAVAAATSEVVVDVDVAAPVVGDATPNLVEGTVVVTLTYDTDAGATKTYAVGDTVTLTISDPVGGILGYAISDATFVDTIVA